MAPAAGQPVCLKDAVDLKQGRDAAHAQMLAICRQALPGWGQLGEADVEFSTVSGGISNINARLGPRAGLGLAPVMFKVFGDKTEQIIDREAEKVVVVALGEQGFGPQVLALFANGRIEQWLHCACLAPADMCSPGLVPRIARQLRRFHSIQVDLPRTPHTPWGVIRDWLAQARTLQFTDPAKTAAYEAIDLSALGAEVDEAEAACALTGSPLVFGHNDLLSGNILVLQPPGFDPAAPDLARGRVVFIDYEYGGYTLRDFDIANHFAEYAGFDGDYSRYPTKQQQELFFRHYLAEDAAMRAREAQQQQLQQQQRGAGAAAAPAACGCLSWMHRKHPPLQQNGQQQQQQQQPVHRLGSLEASDAAAASASAAAAATGAGSGGAADGEEQEQLPPLPADQLDRLSASANVWSLASHLYWGIWAIIQACNSPIDFDYMAFHRTRLGEYHRRKAEYIAEARRLFGGQQQREQEQQPTGGGGGPETGAAAAGAAAVV